MHINCNCITKSDLHDVLDNSLQITALSSMQFINKLTGGLFIGLVIGFVIGLIISPFKRVYKVDKMIVSKN